MLSIIKRRIFVRFWFWIRKQRRHWTLMISLRTHLWCHWINQAHKVGLFSFLMCITRQFLIDKSFVKLILKITLITPYLVLIDILQCLSKHSNQPFVLGFDIFWKRYLLKDVWFNLESRRGLRELSIGKRISGFLDEGLHVVFHSL